MAPNPGNSDVKFNIFCRVEGRGPWLTLLHGFPTCSWDWAKIVDGLKGQRRLLLFDFLGFGDSDKPRSHTYSIFEQADITQFLWRHFEVEATDLLAHNYGDSVALELLARQAEGSTSSRMERAILLNGGIYVDDQRPLLIQKLLQNRLLGWLISRLLNERLFRKQFASIFSKSHPISDSDLKQHWQAITRRNGKKNYHRISRYLTERRQNQHRWEDALETSDVPISFIWGLQDPVSGGSISDRIRMRLPNADLTELVDVGHYPQWESPEIVTQEILRRLMS